MAVKVQSLLMEKKEQVFRILIIAAAVIVLSLVYFVVDARHSGFFPRCPFFVVTGFLCPGCGSQRAISALLHADVMQAMHYNILLVASLPVLLYSSVVSVLNVFRVKPLIQTIFYSTVFVKIVFVSIVLFWIVRNIAAWPFTMLKG